MEHQSAARCRVVRRGVRAVGHQYAARSNGVDARLPFVCDRHRRPRCNADQARRGRRGDGDPLSVAAPPTACPRLSRLQAGRLAVLRNSGRTIIVPAHVPRTYTRPSAPYRGDCRQCGRTGRSQELVAEFNVCARLAARRSREGATVTGISAKAVVETEAIGAAVTIAEFAVVRPDVT